MVLELSFEEALEFIDGKKTKLVWIGDEPVDYIRELLGIGQDRMTALRPGSAVNMSRKEAESYRDCVFVCYHGNSSGHLARLLKDKHGVDAVNLKGGVTSVVGEIF